MSITFSTSFYPLPSKFDVSLYETWMTHFLSIVNHFNLVLYTNEEGLSNIPSFARENPRIRIVVKPLEEFYGYKFKDQWIDNQERNTLLKDKITWEVNMLWNEKINFVNETVQMQYFVTDFYGWCDVGYFRNRNHDLHTSLLSDWAHPHTVSSLDKTKIYYARVNKNDESILNLTQLIQNKREDGLPVVSIPEDQVSIAGGFFILHKEKLEWWVNTFYNKLELYLTNRYLVKDDQIVLIDCILSQPDAFVLIKEDYKLYDPWFSFQRFLYYKVEELASVVQEEEHETITIDIGEIDRDIEPKEKKETHPDTGEIKVSILLCLYNGVEFLDESVFSVVNQTYPHWELLIGINGHPLDSGVFAEAQRVKWMYGNSLNENENKIKVFQFPQTIGKANTLNQLIPLCQYNHIAIIDVDDTWFPEKLERQIPFVTKYDVVGTQCVYFGDIVGVVPPIPLREVPLNFSFIYSNPIINSSVILRKDCCFWNENGVEDYELWLRLRKEGKTFYNCDDVLVNHRIYEESAFNSKNILHLLEEVKNMYR